MPIDSTHEIQFLIDKLRQDFLSGLTERANEMERQLLELEKQPQQSGALAELLRLFHSLKGTAGSYGEYLLSQVCYQFENLLQAYGASQISIDSLIQVGLQYIDFIRSYEKFASDSDDVRLQQAVAALPGIAPGQRTKILVCDKSRVVRESVRMALQDGSREFKFTDNGIAALEMIIREPFDLLITGRQLAELSGMAVVAALRASEHPQSGIPIIMMLNQFTENPSDPKLRYVQRDANFSARLSEAMRALLGN